MKVRHLSDERLLEAALDLNQDAFSRRHLDACASCRQELLDLREASADLAALPAFEVPEGLGARTWEAVERAELQKAARGPSLEEKLLNLVSALGRFIGGPVPAGLLAAAALAAGLVPRVSSISAENFPPEIQKSPAEMIAKLPRPASPQAAPPASSPDPGSAVELAEGAPERQPSNPPIHTEPDQAGDSSPLRPVGEDRPLVGGTTLPPLLAGSSGGSAPARTAAGARAASGQGDGNELGVVGVELRVLGNRVRVETGEKARVLLKVRASLRVVVEIFTAGGAKAASLLDAVLEPGQREVIWDGRAASGVPVASGIYVMAIHGTGFSETLKIVVLK